MCRAVRAPLRSVRALVDDLWQMSRPVGLVGTVMDRRYPQHPVFLAEPKRQDLEALLGWMVDAGEGSVSVAYDENVGKSTTAVMRFTPPRTATYRVLATTARGLGSYDLAIRHESLSPQSIATPAPSAATAR